MVENQSKSLSFEVREYKEKGIWASLDFDQNSYLLGNKEGLITLRNKSTYKAIKELEKVHEDYVYSIKFSPDKTKIITAGYDGFLLLYDINFNLIAKIKSGDNPVLSADFIDNSTVIFITENILFLWNLSENKMIQQIINENSKNNKGLLLIDSKTAIVYTSEGYRKFEISKTSQLNSILSKKIGSISFILLLNNKQISVAQNDFIRFYDITSNEEIYYVKLETSNITNIALVSENRLFIAGDKKIFLYENINGKYEQIAQKAYPIDVIKTILPINDSVILVGNYFKGFSIIKLKYK